MTAMKFPDIAKFDIKAIGLGVVFFVVFWLTLDSLALGLALGTAMWAAFRENNQSRQDTPESR